MSAKVGPNVFSATVLVSAKVFFHAQKYFMVYLITNIMIKYFLNTWDSK